MLGISNENYFIFLLNISSTWVAYATHTHEYIKWNKVEYISATYATHMPHRTANPDILQQPGISQAYAALTQ